MFDIVINESFWMLLGTWLFISVLLGLARWHLLNVWIDTEGGTNGNGQVVGAAWLAGIVMVLRDLSFYMVLMKVFGITFLA